MKRTEEAIRALVGDKFFTVKFIKKTDGEERVMNCRLDVKKHLKGGKLNYDAKAANNLIVWSLDSKGYRTIPLDNLIEIREGGSVTTFKETKVEAP